MKTILFHLSLATIILAASPARAFDHSHASFTQILSSHVRGENFDYAKLSKNPDALGAYLDGLAKVGKSDFNGWQKNEQMAYLINLYNAATLKLVIDHYPVKSIKDIGGLLGSPWKKKVVSLFGEKVTLDHIEHDLLRPKFNEPRIHFAVNCASIGCPPLRNEAFRAADLETQFEEQALAFLRDTSKNLFDAKTKTLRLSPIFDWFKEDFVKKSGSVGKFVAPYFTEKERAVIRGGGINIKHTDYDWSLNKP